MRTGGDLIFRKRRILRRSCGIIPSTLLLNSRPVGWLRRIKDLGTASRRRAGIGVDYQRCLKVRSARRRNALESSVMTTKPQSRRVSKKSAGKSGAESTPIVSPLIKGGHIVLLGDCLDVMTELRDIRGFRESVDLVYLDPPFNSEAEYAFVFGLENADKRAVVAFSDTWKWTEKTEDNYREYIAQGCGGRFLEAMHSTLGTTGTGGAMLSYLTMMLPRLELMRDLMKPTGSIYLHCDQTASHYLKLAMDAIFGADNFHNDVIWGYEKPRSASRVWRRNHDNLLFYTKGRQWKFNPHTGPDAGRKI